MIPGEVSDSMKRMKLSEQKWFNGAVIACITGYGPGLGLSGGFGCYAGFTTAAKVICSFLMLLGRLECLTLLILFIPAFWKK